MRALIIATAALLTACSQQPQSPRAAGVAT